MRPEGIARESSAAVSYAGLAGLPAFNPDQDGDSVAEAVADLGTLAWWHHAGMSAYVILRWKSSTRPKASGTGS